MISDDLGISWLYVSRCFFQESATGAGATAVVSFSAVESKQRQIFFTNFPKDLRVGGSVLNSSMANLR